MASGADLLIQALVDAGIEYLFCNLGTDHAPLIEALARRRALGRRAPDVILCPHENTAVHMAAGYAAATGRGQAVLVHVDAGTANAAMGLHNLCRGRLPVLVMAGKAPFSSHGELPGGRDTYVHFIQEPFDQGSIVRPYVKWEYTLQAPDVAGAVVGRAWSVMQSDPPGPAYLMLPREVLAATCVEPRRAPRAHPVLAEHAVPATLLDDIAGRLLRAEHPVLVTAYAGREPAAVRAIERLAETVGIEVHEFNPVYLNIRRDADAFAGYQPGPAIAQADFGLLVDVDVPWIPRHFQARPDAYWVQFDIDAVKRDLPMWDFPADVRLEGRSALLLAQLLECVQALATVQDRERAVERLRGHAGARRDREARAAQLAASAGKPGALNAHHVCRRLGQRLHAEDVVLNEAIRNMPAVFEQIPRTLPGTLIGLPGGGLGFSAGMALGVRLARPERTVVNLVGDGTFYFSNPASVYAVAAAAGVPILTVVFDNGGWAAVKDATLRVYPAGYAEEQQAFASRLPAGMDFAGMAAACGALGVRLSDPEQVDAAIEQCLHAVRVEGRAAVLHVDVAPF
ncbi:thiamine pyrophosphate-requiring protein [Verticiella sediminum]